MQREVLKEEAVREDLKRALAQWVKNQSNHRLCFLLPLAALSCFLGGLSGRLTVGLILFLPGLYHLLRYAAALREAWLCRRAIRLGAWEWSEECLSHIGREWIYEPHYGYRMPHLTKEAVFFTFRSGKRFRAFGGSYYTQSRNGALSRQGLENLSLEGDRFLFVCLKRRPELSYVYPCKLFAAGELEKR